MSQQSTKKVAQQEPYHEWISTPDGMICKWCKMPRHLHRKEPCPYLRPFYQQETVVPFGPDFRKRCTEGLPVRCGVHDPCKVCLGIRDDFGIGAVNIHYPYSSGYIKKEEMK